MTLTYLQRLHKYVNKMCKIIRIHMCYFVFHNFSKHDLKVSVGAHNSCKWDAKSAIFLVKSAFPHPNYNKETNFADIMLVKLIMRITFDRFVRPICLPELGNFHDYFMYNISILIKDLQ